MTTSRYQAAFPGMSPTPAVFVSSSDGTKVSDGAIAAGSKVLACVDSTPFRPRDAGKNMLILGAGAAGVPMVTTIDRVTDAGHVTLRAAASAGVSSGIVIFGPDVAAELQAAFTQADASGVPLFLPPGRYVVASPVVMPSNLHLIGTHETILSGAMVQTGTEVNNPFQTVDPVASASSTLAAAVKRGSKTISVDDDILAAGDIVRLKSVAPEGNNQRYYFVAQSVTGAGPYAVTLDRPVQFPFAVDSIVEVVPSRPTNIRIEGNGMTLDGSGDTGIQFWGGTRCTVENVNITGSFANWAITCDLGSDRLLIRDVKVRGASHGIAVSSNELTTIERCDVMRSLSHGFFSLDGVDVSFLNCRGTNNVEQGLYIGTNGNTHGGIHTRVIGGNFDGNGTYGVCNQAAGEGLLVEGVSAKYNGKAGIANIAAATLDVIDCDTGPGVNGDGDTFLLRGVSAALPAIYAASAAYVRVRGGRVLADGPAYAGTGINQMGIVGNDAGTRIDVRDVDFQIDAVSATVPNWIGVGAGNDAVAGGAVVSIDNIRMHGGMSGSIYGLSTTSAGTLRIGRVDIDAVGSGTRYLSSGYLSRTVTLTANGTTPVVVAWPDAKSTDRIEFRLTTIGGTPTPRKPIYTITAGTGFSVTFAAGDTSTYEYVIE